LVVPGVATVEPRAPSGYTISHSVPDKIQAFGPQIWHLSISGQLISGINHEQRQGNSRTN
jgi:hypothetical protein